MWEFTLHYCIRSLMRTCFHLHIKEKTHLWSIWARKCITVPRKGCVCVCIYVCVHLALCMSKASTHKTGTKETDSGPLNYSWKTKEVSYIYVYTLQNVKTLKPACLVCGIQRAWLFESAVNEEHVYSLNPVTLHAIQANHFFTLQFKSLGSVRLCNVFGKMSLMLTKAAFICSKIQ